jgi:hypothetical protein
MSGSTNIIAAQLKAAVSRPASNQIIILFQWVVVGERGWWDTSKSGSTSRILET